MMVVAINYYRSATSTGNILNEPELVVPVEPEILVSPTHKFFNKQKKNTATLRVMYESTNYQCEISFSLFAVSLKKTPNKSLLEN